MWNKIYQDYYSHFAGYIEVGVSQLAKQLTRIEIKDIITHDSCADQISLVFFLFLLFFFQKFPYINFNVFLSLMIN